MRKQYIGSSRHSGTLRFVRYSDETAALESKSDFTTGQLFSRSDVTVNPKIDGYRNPSSYSASRLFENNTCGYATVEPVRSPDAGPWPGAWWNEFTGTHRVTIGNRRNGSPPFNSTQQLRTKVLTNVQDELFDVSMVLAEISATAKTGSDIMLRIGRSMHALYKRDVRVFERLWSGKLPTGRDGKPITGRYLDRFNRQTASMYLEWKYGIMPSVYDLQGVTKALDALEKGSLWSNPPLLVSRAVNRSTDTYKVPMTVHEAGGTTAHSQIDVMDRITHKCRLDYTVESDLMHGLNRFGLGLTSLATVAWDKTPFTFVFDMVVPIAQIIKAWGALSGVRTMGYSETWHVHRELSAPQGVPNQRSSGTATNVITLSANTEELMSRAAYKNVPMPLPFIRNPVKVGNMATVLSLFSQLRPKGY